MPTAQKISELTTAGPLTGAELVPVVQNSGTLQTTVSVLKAYAVVSIEPEISALNTRIDQVSALVSSEVVAIASLAADVAGALVVVASLSAAVSSLAVRVDDVSAIATSIGAVVATYDSLISDVSAAVVSVNAVVSALQTQIEQVSALTSVNSAAITSINNAVSALEIRVSAASATGAANSAAITSVNNVVSALDIRLTNVSASVSVLNVQIGQALASISAINSVLATIDVSAIAALEIRVSAVSALTSANTAAIAAVSASVSALNVQMVQVIASISAINSVLATIDVSGIAALEVRVSAVSAAITSINAVVSLKAFRNGDHLTNVQYIDFNTTTSYAPAPGRLTWDIESGTLDLGLTGTVNLLIGQRTVAQVYNNSGVTLSKGKAVKVTGAQGQRLTGALAQADSDADSMTIFGVMLETVSVNNSGYVATDGLVRNVNTAAFADGDIVYLSPVSAGELTPTKPIAPQHLVQMGYVVKGGSVGGGSLYIKVQNGYELGELHNVKTSSDTSIADGEVLAWNASASVWTNSTALTATQASVSVLQLQVNAVSAALTSTNNVVSALEIRVSAASATGATNSAAITSINAVLVSILAILTNTNYRVTE